MNRKYKLETSGCASKLMAVRVMVNCTLMSLKEANDAFNKGEATWDYNLPRFKEMIELLDSLGVAVFDLEKIQLPNVTEVEHEPNAYT